MLVVIALFFGFFFDFVTDFLAVYFNTVVGIWTVLVVVETLLDLFNSFFVSTSSLIDNSWLLIGLAYQFIFLQRLQFVLWLYNFPCFIRTTSSIIKRVHSDIMTSCFVSSRISRFPMIKISRLIFLSRTTSVIKRFLKLLNLFFFFNRIYLLATTWCDAWCSVKWIV